LQFSLQQEASPGTFGYILVLDYSPNDRSQIELGQETLMAMQPDILTRSNGFEDVD
jgi:hypothetical protein